MEYKETHDLTFIYTFWKHFLPINASLNRRLANLKQKHILCTA